MSETKEEKKKGGVAGKIVDGFLGVFVVLLILLEADILITRRKNHGVPSLFGNSFMEVLTDSMAGDTLEYRAIADSSGKPILSSAGALPEEDDEDADDKLYVGHKIKGSDGEYLKNEEGEYVYAIAKRGPRSIAVGDGITVKKVPFSSVQVGDTVTFDGSVMGMSAAISHRVIEKIDSNGDGVYDTLKCFGDNAGSSSFYAHRVFYNDSSAVNVVKESQVVGVVSSKSKSLGGLIRVMLSAWFVPLMVLLPLAVIAGMSVYDAVKAFRLDKKKREAFIQAEISASGVDPKDEAAYEKAKAKAAYKYDIQQEMEEKKAEQKKIYEDAFRSAKEELAAQEAPKEKENKDNPKENDPKKEDER